MTSQAVDQGGNLIVEARRVVSVPISDVILGSPDPKHIATSYVERQNLNMRMSRQWFTRLTNAFSKKFENHAHSVAVHFMYYNFVRIHQTTRLTPAMAAGVTEKLWQLVDMVRVLEAWETEGKAP